MLRYNLIVLCEEGENRVDVMGIVKILG